MANEQEEDVSKDTSEDTSVTESDRLRNTLAWLDILVIYYHLLDADSISNYVLNMLDGKDPPKMLDMRSLDAISQEKFSQHIGLTIKRYRLNKRLTQEELAKDMGFSVPWLTYVEGGRRNISNYDLMRIAKKLKIPTSEIFILNPIANGQ